MPISLIFGTPAVEPDALVISNIVEDQLTDQSVRISWDVSDFAQGWIEWGTTMGGPYPNETTHETSFDYASHIQTISGLNETTAYYYKIVAANLAGTQYRSSEGTFTTDDDIAPPPNPGVTYTDYIIPASIDATGATDVYVAMQNFVNAVPNGTDATHRSRVRPPSATAVYQMTRGICLGGKAYMDFDGLGTGTNGATLNAHPTTYTFGGFAQNTSNFLVGVTPMTTGVPVSQSTDIKIYGWQLNGNAATNGSTPAFQGEWQCNVFVGPVNGLEIYNISTNRARGDVIGIAGYGAFNGYIHDIVNVRSERQFLTFDYAEDWLVEDFEAGISAYYFCDIEQGGAGRSIKRITVRNGTTAGWDQKTSSQGGGFIAAFNQSFSPAGEDVLFDNIVGVGSNPRNTIQSYIGGNTTQRIDGFTVRNCSFTASLANGTGNLTLRGFRVRNVDGLTITGNTQPGAAGPGTWYEPGSPNNCTSVTFSGNTP